MQPSRLLDAVGSAWGALLAPATAGLSALRRARMFHPRGIVLRGQASPAIEGGVHAEIGARLAGPVLVRFSGATWKKARLPDVLGCAVRFTHHKPLSARPAHDDQDLLLATVRHPLTTLLAPLTTYSDDFLKNDYFGVSPFDVPPLSRVKLRLVALTRHELTGDRYMRLREALARGNVLLRLDLREARLGAPYDPIAYLELHAPTSIADEALRFDPFRAGRGLRPVGLVHHLRIGAYAGSQLGRRIFHPR